MWLLLFPLKHLSASFPSHITISLRITYPSNRPDGFVFGREEQSCHHVLIGWPQVDFCRLGTLYPLLACRVYDGVFLLSGVWHIASDLLLGSGCFCVFFILKQIYGSRI
jgi:hypothetical protein